MTQIMDTLTELFKPVIESFGYKLWGIEYLPQGTETYLRIYVDRAEGVSLDDCATISRQIGAVLDVEDIIFQRYILEVSSPGVERILFTPEQFGLYMGKRIKVRLAHSIDGHQNAKGELLAVLDNSIELAVDKEKLTIDFDNIKKARLLAF